MIHVSQQSETPISVSNSEFHDRKFCIFDSHGDLSSNNCAPLDKHR